MDNSINPTIDNSTLSDVFSQVYQKVGDSPAAGVVLSQIGNDLGFSPVQLALEIAKNKSASAVNSSLSPTTDTSGPTTSDTSATMNNINGEAPQTSENWDQFVKSAQQISKQTGFPLSVMLGQAALESARGQSNFAKNRNNFFGFEAYDSNPNNAKSYATPEQSIQDYVNLILNTPRYAQAAKDINDPYKMLQDIKSAGYATSPTYVQNVSNTPEFQQYLP